MSKLEGKLKELEKHYPSEDELELEIWKDLPGLEGKYRVSNYGRMKSLSREVSTFRATRIIKERILKPNIDGAGYLFFMLGFPNRRSYKVHRWIASLFIDNPLELGEVNHIDGNKLNNRVDNLEWSSPKQNSQHTFKIGHPSKRIHFQIEDILNIRKLYEDGKKNGEIAKLYGQSRKTIWRITTKKSWTFID